MVVELLLLMVVMVLCWSQRRGLWGLQQAVKGRSVLVP